MYLFIISKLYCVVLCDDELRFSLAPLLINNPSFFNNEFFELDNNMKSFLYYMKLKKIALNDFVLSSKCLPLD